MTNSRGDLERNMYLLNELFSEDKIRIDFNEKNLVRGIQNVRRAPNNRAALNSISESANAMTSHIPAMALRLGNNFDKAK